MISGKWNRKEKKDSAGWEREKKYFDYFFLLALFNCSFERDQSVISTRVLWERACEGRITP